MAESLVDKAVREAEEACQHAIASTPEKYRGFITLISQNKRIGSRQNPQYATIRLPYMTVDGRICWARDEHRAAGASLTIQTMFDPVGDHLACKAIVTSPLLGSAVGHAVVNFGGSGVDASNPIENSESSAIGRALGALGYGLFGTGVASADEVLAAMPESARQRVAEMNKPPAPEPEPELATQGHLGVLYGWLSKCGVADGHKRKLVELAFPDGMTKDECTREIRAMEMFEQLPDMWKLPYIKLLISEHGHDRKLVGAHMDNAYGHHDPSLLTASHFLELISHLNPESQPEPEPEPQPDEPDDIYMPGEMKSVATELASVKEWMELLKKAKVSSVKFEKWVLSQYNGGNVKDYTKLPREVYKSLDAMDIDKMRQEIDEFQADEDKQEAIPY